MHEKETPNQCDPVDFEDKEDIYANTLYGFFRDLTTLAAEAEEQCRIELYYNVAWEIRYFFTGSVGAVIRGDAVLGLPGMELSDEQREALSALCAAVEAIPDAVVNVPNLKENHLNAMRNPCWVPIRIKAREIMSLLEPQRRWAYSALGMADQL